MNKLKSVFITLYIVSLFVGTAIGLFHFVGNVSEVKYLAGLLINILPLLFFVILYIKKPSNIGGLITVITALIGTVFLIALGRTLFETQGIDLVFVFSFVSLLGWILYLMWYSKFNHRNIQSLVGSTIDDLIFFNAQGKTIRLTPDDHLYHILLFHRGNWCPFCMAQVRDIAHKYHELTSRKVKVHIVSPVNEIWTSKMAKKFDVDFDFLMDKDLAVSTQLGIVHSNGLPLGFQLLGFDSDTILPTVILLDHDLKVLRIHETDDYKKRPEPDFFLRLIDSY